MAAYVTVASTPIPAALRSVIVCAVMVLAFIASLNVTLTLPFTEAFVAPLAGEVEATVGGVVSTVVNDHVKFDASEFPAASLTPLAPPTTVAVYVVGPPVSALVGVNVATRVVAS